MSGTAMDMPPSSAERFARMMSVAPRVRAVMAFRHPIAPAPMIRTLSPGPTASISCAFRQQASGSVSAAAAELSPSGILLTQPVRTARPGMAMYCANPPGQLAPMSKMS